MLAGGVVALIAYDASDPQTNRHASGIAKETLITATDASGAMEIVWQKEQVSKANSNRFDKEASDVPGLKSAKAEYEASAPDEAARVRYVTKLADMSAQLTPKILHNPDLDAKVAYANQAGAIEEELRKHPMPRNVDSRKLSQLLVGKWQSPRHTYAFRADGTYGIAHEDRVKWRIDGNEYVDDVSGGPIILVDRNYFIYACGQGVLLYTRVKDSEAERNELADTNTQNTAEEVNSTSTVNGERPSDSAIKQRLLGYWKSPRHGYYISADGKMYMCPRKYATTINYWDVNNGMFYQDGAACAIVTLTDKKFVYRDSKGTYTLMRGSKEEIDPQ